MKTSSRDWVRFQTECRRLCEIQEVNSDGILCVAACILSHQSNSQLETGFERLAKYCIESANVQIASDEVAQKGKGPAEVEANVIKLKAYIPVLDRLSILFQYVRVKEEVVHGSGQEHPCKQVIGQCLLLILSVLRQFIHSEKVSEKGCRTLRYSIRCLSLHFDVYLADLVQNLVELYSQSGFSCYLYVGGT